MEKGICKYKLGERRRVRNSAVLYRGRRFLSANSILPASLGRRLQSCYHILFNTAHDPSLAEAKQMHPETNKQNACSERPAPAPRTWSPQTPPGLLPPAAAVPHPGALSRLPWVPPAACRLGLPIPPAPWAMGDTPETRPAVSLFLAAFAGSHSKGDKMHAFTMGRGSPRGAGRCSGDKDCSEGHESRDWPCPPVTRSIFSTRIQASDPGSRAGRQPSPPGACSLARRASEPGPAARGQALSPPLTKGPRGPCAGSGLSAALSGRVLAGPLEQGAKSGTPTRARLFPCGCPISGLKTKMRRGVWATALRSHFPWSVAPSRRVRASHATVPRRVLP